MSRARKDRAAPVPREPRALDAVTIFDGGRVTILRGRVVLARGLFDHASHSLLRLVSAAPLPVGTRESVEISLRSEARYLEKRSEKRARRCAA